MQGQVDTAYVSRIRQLAEDAERRMKEQFASREQLWRQRQGESQGHLTRIEASITQRFREAASAVPHLLSSLNDASGEDKRFRLTWTGAGGPRSLIFLTNIARLKLVWHWERELPYRDSSQTFSIPAIEYAAFRPESLIEKLIGDDGWLEGKFPG